MFIGMSTVDSVVKILELWLTRLFIEYGEPHVTLGDRLNVAYSLLKAKDDFQRMLKQANPHQTSEPPSPQLYFVILRDSDAEVGL